MSWLWGEGDKSKMPPKGMGTLFVHLGHGSDTQTGAIVPPISLSTTFEQRSPGVPLGEYEYSRSGNPTRGLLENAIAKLEGAEHGLAFPSGSAVTTTICHLLEPGAHILSVSDVYGGTKRYLARVLSGMGVETTFTAMHSPTELVSLIKPTTRMVWVETPTNPTLNIVDIKAVCEVIHGIRSDIIVVIDNTFMTPYLQRPLEHGADIVVHSATKYLNGHCDVVMGLLVTSKGHLFERLKFLQNSLGVVPSPFDCYLTMRGMRTLHVRMDRHCKNALQVATYLSSHPHVETVMYPGLASHPGFAVAGRQQNGHGGIVSLRLKGDLSQTCKFCASTKIFVLAESLGGVESLIDVPAVMTHGAVSPQERKELGITDTFIRLSVGIEDCDDLIADLKQALEAAFTQ
jgi:cystathionine gamma-lyase